MATLSARSLSSFQHARRGVLFVLLLGVVLALLFVGSYPPQGALHEFVEAIGVGFIGVAVIGRLWCTLYIGGRKSAEIVQDGPYSISRNPLYVFSAIGAAGVGGQTGSVTVALFFGIVTAAAFHVVILREERYLHEAFGAAYGAYCHRVPRFFPRLSLYKDSQSITVLPKRLYVTFFDSLVFFVAIPVFESIEYLQLQHVLPTILLLP